MFVRIFVHAPESMRGAFDGIGCPTLEAWGESAGLVLPLNDDSLHIFSIPQEQAAFAVAHLTEQGAASPLTTVEVAPVSLAVFDELLSSEGAAA